MREPSNLPPGVTNYDIEEQAGAHEPPPGEPTPGVWVHLGAPEAVICDGPGVCTVAEGRHVSVLDLEERLRRAEERARRVEGERDKAIAETEAWTKDALRAEKERDAAREAVRVLAEAARSMVTGDRRAGARAKHLRWLREALAHPAVVALREVR